jgi:hypothetical protein
MGDEAQWNIASRLRDFSEVWMLESNDLRLVFNEASGFVSIFRMSSAKSFTADSMVLSVICGLHSPSGGVDEQLPR